MIFVLSHFEAQQILNEGHIFDYVISIRDMIKPLNSLRFKSNQVEKAFIELCFEDDDVGEFAPNHQHISSLIDFCRSIREEHSVLIHCRAGVCRSMSAARILLYLQNRPIDEQALDQICEQSCNVLNRNPFNLPWGSNKRMLELADQILNSNLSDFPAWGSKGLAVEDE